jgi:hypothetical protein
MSDMGLGVRSPCRGQPAELKHAIKLISVLIAVAGGLWAYLHLLAFLKERGIASVATMLATSREGGNSNSLSRKPKRRASWRGNLFEVDTGVIMGNVG